MTAVPTIECAAAATAGRFTREEEVRHCAERLVKEVRRLREMSPLYEGAIEGDGEKGPKLVWT